MASDRADSAVVAARVPFRAANAEWDPDQAKLAKLKGEQSSYNRSQVVQPQPTRVGFWVGNAARNDHAGSRAGVCGFGKASGAEGVVDPTYRLPAELPRIRPRPLRGVLRRRDCAHKPKSGPQAPARR